MPTRWVCSGPREFDAQHAGAFERPWFDIGLVRLLNSVQYPFVCRLHGVFRSDLETFVATTFCDGGDLFEWCFRETLPDPGVEREAQMQPIARRPPPPRPKWGSGLDSSTLAAFWQLVGCPWRLLSDDDRHATAMTR